MLLAGVAGGIAFPILPIVGVKAGLALPFIGVILAANRVRIDFQKSAQDGDENIRWPLFK